MAAFLLDFSQMLIRVSPIIAVPKCIQGIKNLDLVQPFA